MTDKPRRRTTLRRIVLGRFLLFAAAAAAVQTGVVVADYYFNDRQLASLMVDHEADLLFGGLSHGDGGFRFSRPQDLPRYSADDPDYLTRIHAPERQRHLQQLRSDLRGTVLAAGSRPSRRLGSSVSSGQADRRRGRSCFQPRGSESVCRNRDYPRPRSDHVAGARPRIRRSSDRADVAYVSFPLRRGGPLEEFVQLSRRSSEPRRKPNTSIHSTRAIA